MRGHGVAIVLAWAAVGWAGCAEFYDAQWNALGHINVNEPPRSSPSREPEQPSDPGLRIVWLTAGALSGGGTTLSSRAAGAYGVGGEVSLHVGTIDRTPSPPIPDRALGLNLGINLVDSTLKRVGPAYAEAQFLRRGMWFAGGWAFDVGGGAQGPQATVGLGPVFIRYRQLFDTDGTILFGLAVKGGVSWVTSR